MARRTYKLELRNPESDERVDFGPRKIGDIGRDILIVKKTLGALVTYQSLIDEGEQNPSIEDPEGWFDCITGTKISDLEAATFDRNMLAYLTKFQLDNQFYILSYLFSKFSMEPSFEDLPPPSPRPAENLESDSLPLSGGGAISLLSSRTSYSDDIYASTHIDLLVRMFNTEFGQLGEATLAVLHGWIPRTRVGATSYHHDPRIFEPTASAAAYDVTLLGIYYALTTDKLTQKLINSEDILNPTGPNAALYGSSDTGQDYIGKYRDQVSAKEDVAFGLHISGHRVSPSSFGTIKYKVKPQDSNSALYDSFIIVSNEMPRPQSTTLTSARDFSDSLHRSVEPNPLIDPDPFVVSNSKIVFYDRTEHTLENLPPTINKETATPEQVAEYRTAIRELEDKALTRVLDFYNKPNVWFLNPESAKYEAAYSTNPAGVLPAHSGHHTASSNFVLTTNTNIVRYSLNSGSVDIPDTEAAFRLGEIENYNKIEYSDYAADITYNAEEKPIIKFTEFHTPSLRPGDVYRARFEINKLKLDLVTEGLHLKLQRELPEAETTSPVAISSLAPSCEDTPISKQDEQRRYEEYRALANKRKREILRLIREKGLESYDTSQTAEDVTVDLGVFGSATLDLGEGNKDRKNSYEFTAQALDQFSNFMGPNQGPGTANSRSEKIENPKLADFTTLKISYQDLKSGVKKSATNLRKAYENCKKEKVQITPSSYNGNDEAARLNNSIIEIKNLILKQSQSKPEFTFDLGEDERELTLSGFMGSDSILEFQFESFRNGLRITSLKGDGQVIDIKDLKSTTALKDTLGRARTVGYLAQVEDMSDGNGSLISFLGLDSPGCSDLNLGKKGLAYIAKHTMKLTGKLPEEYDPIHRWTYKSATKPITDWKNSILSGISSDLEVKLGVDEVLDLFGEKCNTLEALYGLINELRPGTLLCKYMKCVRLPAFDFQFPNFHWPLKPDFKIFGWLRGLIEQIKEKWKQILMRILCAFAKMIIDFLKAPFCADQLREELYGAAVGASPGIQNALASALTDLSLKPGNIDKSKQLIDEMVLFLTGDEICRILQGGEIDAPTMNMIMRLAERLEIDEVETEETLRAFFETVSLFLPEGFCEELAEATSVIAAASCKETSTLLDQIRRRMLANEATDEEIEKAIDLANKNLLSESAALEALAKGGIASLLPTVLEFGNPDALISELPKDLGEQIVRATKSLFDTAKIGYVSSLSSFGPSLFLKTARLPKPSDPVYDEESSIIVETILENLKEFARISGNILGPPTEGELHQQLFVLHRIFELEVYPGSNGVKVPKMFKNPGGQYVVYDDRGNHEVNSLKLNPVGVKQAGFFYTDEESNIKLRPPRQDPPFVDNGATRARGMQDPFSFLNKFSFVGAYKITKKALEDEVVNPAEVSAFLQEKISARLSELQSTLQSHLENITTTIPEETYLGIIKDLLDFSYENERERRNIQNAEDQGGQTTELINAFTRSSRPTIDLSLATGEQRTNIRLSEFQSTEDSSRFDPYTIEIKNSPLFQEEEIFEYCDAIPGPGYDEASLTPEQAENKQMFEDAISDIPAGLYTRKELFTRKFWDSVRSKVGYVYNTQGERLREGVPEFREILNGYQTNFLHDYSYNTASPEFSEGIFEQIFFSLRNSRIYDEEGYYPGLKRRVNGELYITQDGCYKNRYNVSQFGILSFEKIVTDELAEQINIELAKPENQPNVLDFDDIGPIEKAIQNVCLVGFVRVCIVELLLKGSLAYSVWDLEGVSDEPFMKDFVYRFVRKEIESKPSIEGKWKEIIARITGIEQANFALKDLVQKQLIKVQGASKKIYENSPNVDYYNWFIKYFVPQTEVSRQISHSANKDLRDDERFSVQRVNTQGAVVDSARTIIENVADKITWVHPLYEVIDPNRDVANYVQMEDTFSELRDPVKLAQDLVNGHNPFFHIEHCLEVMGPLARLETLEFPTVNIINNILNADVSNPEDVRRITEVDPSRRNIPRLNVVDAHARFTNLGFPDIIEYDLRSRPIIQPGAEGSSVESATDLNREHEIYHIDDFVDALSNSLNSDHLDKYLLHIRGLMHFDQSPTNAPGGIEGNTNIQGAQGMPDAIRRMPTRFITRKRRIINFTADFVSPDTGEFIEIPRPENNAAPIESYKNGLFGADGNRPSDFLREGDVDRSNTAHNLFSAYITQPEDESETVKYYVLPSDGEEFIGILSSNPELDLEINDGQFMSYVIEESDTATSQTSGEYVDYSYSSLIEDGRETIRATTSGTGTRQIKTKTILHRAEDDEVLNTNLDGIDHDWDGDGVGNPLGQSGFNNQLGVFRTPEGFNSIKEKYELRNSQGSLTRQDETWVETVFDFSDSASIIAGLHGSFTIGETFDPAVLRFRPSEATNTAFNVALRTQFQNLNADNEAFDNVHIGGTADPKLTQYGRTFYTRANPDRPGAAHPEVYPARPMGIDRYTNEAVTKFWTVSSNPGPNAGAAQPSGPENGSFVGRTPQPEVDSGLGREVNEALFQATRLSNRFGGLKLIHSRPTLNAAGDELVFNRGSLLPPNFYKIPMRVLVTQIYVNGAPTPSEVYCKVVPPKYITEMHESTGLRTNIAKLNRAIQSLINEYVEFIDDVLPTLNRDNPEYPVAIPEFTTDFTRNHARDWDISSLSTSNMDPKQYCSIERIYSQVFKEETLDTDTYNTEDELDEMFRDRGNLLKRGNPSINSLSSLALSDGPAITPHRNALIDKKHYLETFNYFYDLPQEGNLTTYTAQNFHKTVFSLHNVFQWYLRHRRKNTLWGQLTAPTIVDTAAATNSGRDQEFPLAQSYSPDWNDGSNTDNHGSSGPLRNLDWAIAIHKPKEYTSWISNDKNNADNEYPDRTMRGRAGRENRRNLSHGQPGFITLYPGRDDVNEASDEAFDQSRRRISKNDFREWTFFGPGTDGIISDGKGSNFVNYNRIEACPIRNAGSSMFYADGMISQTDISVFIRSVVRKLMDDNYTDRDVLPPGDPKNFFDFNRFAGWGEGAVNAEILNSLLGGDSAHNELNFFLRGVVNQVTRRLEEARPLFRTRNNVNFNPQKLVITEEKIDEAIKAVYHIVSRLYGMSVNQSAFSVKSEVSQYNKDMLQSPYRLGILRRFLRKIRDSTNTPHEKLFLLCLASFPDLAPQIASNNAIGQGSVDVDTARHWAAACLHFLAFRWVRNRAALEGASPGLAEELIVFKRNFADGLRWKVSEIHARTSTVSSARDFAGDDGRDTTAINHWALIRSWITASEIDPLYIIEAANNVYGALFPDAVPGFAQFRNNHLILQSLKSEPNNEEYMITKYGELYNNTYAQFTREITSAISSEIIGSSYLDHWPPAGYYDSISTGKIEDFFLKMDYRLFYQVMGRDSDASHSRFSRNVRYIYEHLSNNVLHVPVGGSKLDYYNELIPRILYKSESFSQRREEIINSIKNNYEKTANKITEDWKATFDTFSGITSELLGAETLRDAIINGEMVEGLLRNSEINQLARLVSNTFIPDTHTRVQDTRDFREFVKADGPIQEISEEFRTFTMAKSNSDTGKDIFSVPMAEKRKLISANKELTINCFDLSTFRRDYKRMQPWLTEQLIESDSARQIFEYIFPVKRFQAISTAFATSALAGYGEMTSIMQSPKANLASLINIAGMKPIERTQIFDNFGQADFYKHLMDNTSSSPKGLACFDFPGPGDFFEQFLNTLWELIKEFPSLFFRGIASVADPAYKEMKLHWENCSIDKLTFSGVKGSTINYGNITAGLVDPAADTKLDGKYAMVIPSSMIDLTVGTAIVASNPFSSAAWGKLGRAIERTSGYLYKGPLAIVDGVFSFSIPCLDKGAAWPGESPAPFHLDRYGHPMSPLTMLALATPELKGDKKMRDQSGCADNPYSAEKVEEAGPCDESEPKPFGDMPKPEE